MQLLSIAFAALSVLASASAAPHKPRAGPSGTLVTPNDGTTWDNTGGWGEGHVVYNGVSQSYNNSQGVTYVRTHHIDISLEAQDGSGRVYYLARGIAPPALTVDQYFQIPYGYGGQTGDYRLVIEETQVGYTAGQPIPITFKAAAPLIHITAGPTP